MSSTRLLIDYPYRNVYFCEDRILSSELAAVGRFISVEHIPQRTRISLKGYQKILNKVVKSQYSGMVATFGSSPDPLKTLNQYAASIIQPSSASRLILSIRLLRLILLPFALAYGLTVRRQPLISLVVSDYRAHTNLSLQKLEEISS